MTVAVLEGTEVTSTRGDVTAVVLDNGEVTYTIQRDEAAALANPALMQMEVASDGKVSRLTVDLPTDQLDAFLGAVREQDIAIGSRTVENAGETARVAFDITCKGENIMDAYDIDQAGHLVRNDTPLPDRATIAPGAVMDVAARLSDAVKSLGDDARIDLPQGQLKEVYGKAENIRIEQALEQGGPLFH